MDKRKHTLNGFSNSRSNIKGLQLFIADLRQAHNSDEQEKRIQLELVKVRQQFNQHHRAESKKEAIGIGYQRKKYIAKLIYVYITSNTLKLDEILFALPQVCELIRSNVYSEKYMGYMALELLYAHSNVVRSVEEDTMQQIELDLKSSDNNNAALALNFIGVTGSMDNGLSKNNEIIDAVFSILRSPTSPNTLKKKSALSFLALVKKNPVILTDDLQRKQIWIQRIISLLDDTENYRLILVALPLLEYIATYIDPSSCMRLIPQLSTMLHTCLMASTYSNEYQKFPAEYKFAKYPNPWLITKLMGLLNVLLLPQDTTPGQLDIVLNTSNLDILTRDKLQDCISAILEIGNKSCSDQIEKSVQNSIVLSLVNFSSKLQPSGKVTLGSIEPMCKLLQSPDINSRYLALDTLTKICFFSGPPAIEAMRDKHLNLIFSLLNNERDPSIVRKTVNLLYTFTDASNVKLITNKMLDAISHSKNLTDANIRSEIAIKVADLCEKYATDPTWYISTSLKILGLKSITSLNSDEIWPRLCQIIVNNPSLHTETCKGLIDHLKDNAVSEAVVKTSAFILGQCAGTVSGIISIEELMSLLMDNYGHFSNTTKAMILTTLMQIYSYDTSNRSRLINFLKFELNALDTLLQTRAFEYLNILQYFDINNINMLLKTIFEPIPPFSNEDIPLLKRLGSLPLTHDRYTSHKLEVGNLLEPDTSVVVNEPNPYYQKQILSPNWKEGFSRMINYKQGIMLSSRLIKILYRTFPSNEGELYSWRYNFSYINESDWDIIGLSTEIIPFKTSGNPDYYISDQSLPSQHAFGPKKRSEQSINIILRRPFLIDESPILVVHFRCGASTNQISLKIPISPTNTLTKSPSINDIKTFWSKWNLLSELHGSACESFDEYNLLRSNYLSSMAGLTVTIKRIGFNVVQEETVTDMIHAAGVINTKSDGDFECLLEIRLIDISRIRIACKVDSGSNYAKYLVDCIKYALV